MREVWPGDAFPLGATWDGSGTNFGLFSEVAEQVEVCLFEADGKEERIVLPEVDGFVWHGYLPGVGPGQRYGYRVHGPYTPETGDRCNPAKLLLDPYGKAVEGEVRWHEALFSYRFGDPDELNTDDSAPYMPKNVVINPFFDWADDRPPRTPYHQTVIYEAHVRGLTMRHPGIPEEQRGTYAGLAHPVMIDHLLELGVTAVELMPVHQFVPEHAMVARGLTNYWGYNTIGFLAPHNTYSATGQCGEQVLEFKAMVRTLHQAGIEVILDVVYNHTAEGDHLGPTMSFRGIDNSSYYRLRDDDRRYHLDYTGCGNSLNVRSPHALQLIMDSLRYWILEMHVDGFRFDLASALARELHDVDRLAAFFDLVQQDPVVSQVKLIAEPWDVGEGGYQVGNFPPLWSEWNGKYRDTVRDFWRGSFETLPEFASRLTGSSDLYEHSARRPFASVNFVTCHDGFTLADLVAYEGKHNEANGEDNRDGTDDNRAWNCGAEGPTDDPTITELRARQRRNFLATLFLSQGVPMLSHGDELARTQQGNNNAYCQDNELTWIDWEAAEEAAGDLEFVRILSRLRHEHPVFRRRRFFQGAGAGSDGH
ncbi:glycogen debranching protein GlgX, partial [Spirillospora sp. NPDC049652]